MHLQHAAIVRAMPSRRADATAPATSAEQIASLLRRRGLRMTPQRHAIVAEILRSSGHIAPATLAERVRRALPGVNASTVYRTLDVLEEVGVLRHAHLEGGAEYHRAEDAGHVHLTCSRCGRGEDLSAAEAGRIARLIDATHGFSPDLTHFAIAGTCRRCRARSSADVRVDRRRR